MLCHLQFISSAFTVSFQAVSERNLETTVGSAVSSACVQYCKTLLLSVAVFISQYSTAITNITFSPSVQSYSHTVGLHADRQQCLLLLNNDTFAGWVTGSLHHILTGIFFSSLANHSMNRVQMRHECWISQESPSCSPRHSVCHNWTATVATHSCMLGCENILAVTASR